ncbi:phosphatidylinositol N-acetylglucosaminyltransferase subunit H-like [Hyposmocoma kahamanoa]|uniref:phosphatidylinositol N-acetylglucosaminyltransferase subunit H-like n=1 Tax=Hyposmocoma kahamanoa TaxID=1477025 RepID=UPI000E6D604F|nr:phosphatidylinositol N-acetylglucosaminyltransferase subunit H-like [Hyposmocoma kahamanoa]
MAKSDSVVEFDNVNGFPLYLKVDSRSGSPKSKYFTISYKTKENKSNWPLLPLFLALFFNVIAMCYITISVTTIVVIIIVLTFLLFFYMTRCVQSESLLVIPTVGIQSSIKYVYGRENNFIPWSCVDDVIINEVIKLNRVLYYLTILVKTNYNNPENEAIKLIPLFKYTKPRLMMLERIYSELQTLLMEAPVVDAGMGSGDIG